MKPPIWFLDIDGVINSIGAPSPDTGVDISLFSLTMVSTQRSEWPIRWSRKVVTFINEMNRSGLAEVQWLTTWEDDARVQFAPSLGLDDFPSHAIPEDPDDGLADALAGKPDRRRWWKENVVRQALGDTGRPFVWTDDDLEDSIRESLLEDFPQCSLMIRPSLNPGLTDAHLDEIRTFLSQVVQGASDTAIAPHSTAGLSKDANRGSRQPSGRQEQQNDQC